MSMTLDFADLMLIFDKAYCANLGDPATKISSDRAGVIAVVLALKDELCEAASHISNIGGMDALDIAVEFNNILGDAGEKAAGGPTSNDGQDVLTSSVRTPAADPSPEVCEWEKLRTSWGFKTSCSTKWLMNENYGGDTCPLCEKRIEYKITEPKP